MFAVTGHSRPALLAALIAVAVYFVTLWGTYTYDDVAIVLEDPRIHALWLDEMRKAGMPSQMGTYFAE